MHSHAYANQINIINSKIIGTPDEESLNISLYIKGREVNGFTLKIIFQKIFLDDINSIN